MVQNDLLKSKCNIAFEDQTIYIHVENGKIDVKFKDPATGRESLKSCFKIELPEDYFSEEHDSFMFISAYSGDKIPNEHIIHGVRFHDSHHVHDEDEVDKAADLKPFSGRYNDIVRKRAIDSRETWTVDSYNKELLRHNQIYSQLASDFIANSETIIRHLGDLPHHEVIQNMTQTSESMKARFSMLNSQFTDYNTDIKTYKEHIENGVNARDMSREMTAKKGDKPAQKEQ